MKSYDKNEAVQTLEAILVSYDKVSLAKELAILSVAYSEKNNGWKFKKIEELLITKDNNNKFIVKIGNE